MPLTLSDSRQQSILSCTYTLHPSCLSPYQHPLTCYEHHNHTPYCWKWICHLSAVALIRRIDTLWFLVRDRSRVSSVSSSDRTHTRSFPLHLASLNVYLLYHSCTRSFRCRRHCSLRSYGCCTHKFAACPLRSTYLLMLLLAS